MYTIQYATAKFESCSSCHITGDDISKVNKGITNATLVSEATV
jgi:hypothetical protein